MSGSASTVTATIPPMQRRLDGRTILAVDDDPDILAGMALALEAEAAKVIRAADGAQAWGAV